MSFIEDAANDIVRGVVIRSQITPEFNVDPFAKGVSGSQNGFTKAILQIVKPSIVVKTSLGDAVVEPEGPPTTNLFPVAIGIVAIVLGFAVFGAYCAIAD